MNKTHPSLSKLLRACLRQDRQSQKELYRKYYAYAMNICLHYSNSPEEAQEILNDGFLKVFRKLEQYSSDLSFKGWLRKVLINSAIDYHRRYNKHTPTLEIISTIEPYTTKSGFDKLAMDDLLGLIQRLPPMYRLVFNLYMLEGLKHEEIANKLNISVGASKSNLSRAKAKLRQMLEYTDSGKKTNKPKRQKKV